MANFALRCVHDRNFPVRGRVRRDEKKLEEKPPPRGLLLSLQKRALSARPLEPAAMPRIGPYLRRIKEAT